MDTFLIIAGIILLLILWSFIEKKLLTTTNYLLSSPKLGKNFQETAFVVLADLHNQTFGRHNKRLIRKIDQRKPDFIIIVGDMITKKRKCRNSNAFTLISLLTKKYKIYYAYGNHEQYMELLKTEAKHLAEYQDWLNYRQDLLNLGVIFLNNTEHIIAIDNTNIHISGVTIDAEYYNRKKPKEMQVGYIETQLGKKKGETYHILIAHSPVYFKEYINWGADLTLAGHLHGGLIRLPFLGGMLSPQVEFFPKYDAGSLSEDGKVMIVSKGMGSHSALPRLFNPPEIVHITLKGNAR